MCEDELLYRLALTLIPNIGDVQARTLITSYGDAKSIFKCSIAKLEKLDGIGTVRAAAVKSFNDFHTAEQELKFIIKNKITPVFLTDKDYPKRLLNCYDAPPLLFYKGTANLNASRIISVVGTRSQTSYGRSFTEKMIHDLAPFNVTIVSGLALGIDASAHRAAMANNAPTIAVVGHGLDKIYPYEHRTMMNDMIEKGGGILTEFFSGTKPDRHHFPLRNRIVAGLSDATILIESNLNGGSMITAKLAGEYNRDVFALPGRSVDDFSSGPNHMIKHNKALLMTSAEDVINAMNWKDETSKPKLQRALFIELSPEQQTVHTLLTFETAISIDEINSQINLSPSLVSSALLTLEMEGLIESLPGKCYRKI